MYEVGPDMLHTQAPLLNEDSPMLVLTCVPFLHANQKLYLSVFLEHVLSSTFSRL